MLYKVSLYWQTLRHLKPVQFYGRLWFRLYRPGIYTSTPEPLTRVEQGVWQTSAARAPSMLGPEQFRFLNIEYCLPTKGGWNDAALSKLWLYNLHYFDDMNAADAGKRLAWHRALLERWLLENPPASGNGWEPYPTSVRIVNWVKWLASGNSAVPGMLKSLALQADWLARRLEWHLRGNHLFTNAKALIFAGLLFEGPRALSWLVTGLKIIKRELPEQVLADGGNFERSPMYHAIFLEDLLDLVNAATHWPGLVPDAQLSKWRKTVKCMLGWLVVMTHPDGEIALFNDAAFGVTPGVAELWAYAGRVGIETNSLRSVCAAPTNITHRHLANSGYVRLESDVAAAFLDVAPIGPDYLPGHAHADTLSFELSVFGQRVVVNGGTSRYGLGPERLRERGTAAHSTVEVAGENSSEVWGGFRVARRAYPFDLDLDLKDEAGVLKVACSHDGYTRLPGAPVHRREWVMDIGSLRVSDTVRGGAYAAVARYILHTKVSVTTASGNNWQLTLAGGQCLRVVVLVGHGRLESASYAPEFGKILPTQSLVIELTDGQAVVEWLWS